MSGGASSGSRRRAVEQHFGFCKALAEGGGGGHSSERGERKLIGVRDSGESMSSYRCCKTETVLFNSRRMAGSFK